MVDRLSEGTKLLAKYTDGEYYQATVAAISESKKRAKAPVKVSFIGYEAEGGTWLGLESLVSKKLAKANPKSKAKAKARAKVEMDLSGLSKGLKVQAEEDGKWYAAEVVFVSESKNRAKAPVKVHWTGYTKESEEWLGADRLRSKALASRQRGYTEAGGRRRADPSTLSEPVGPGRARVLHTDFSMTVDFVGRRLLGHVDLQCACNQEAPAEGKSWELVLDASESLAVSDVAVDGKPLGAAEWSRDEKRRSSILGLAIRVTLLDGAPGKKHVVRLSFETQAPQDDGTGGCSALGWLQPSQTAGKKFPYVFSQSQAIHSRSMFPCQDTCECKSTYSAAVRCPAEFTALMSAVKGDTQPCEEPEWETPEGCGKAWVEHRFEQKLPIPPYLIALACGVVESRRIGPRSLVWSEKENVDACAWEFADTERIIAAGENLCGPYQWGQYDLLIMPPSFPYGGMENPCLTFATPTLLAKDRSQVHVVAHEAAHSWSGNLVTNETWEHFWLNEGLTTFTQFKIVRDVFGEEEAALQLSEALTDLREAVDHFGGEHNFTKLCPDLSDGSDPDDAFSTVPYIKGMALFLLLEKHVGGEKNFQPFLKAYFEKFGGKTVTSQGMRNFFFQHFRALAKTNVEVKAALDGPLKKLDWKRLWTAPGLPDWMPPVDLAVLQAGVELAGRWAKAGSSAEALAAFSAKDIEGWSSTKRSGFLDALLSSLEDSGGNLSTEACARMQECYGLLTANCELRIRFLRLALEARWAGARDAAVDLATTQGRMKYTRPIYRFLKAYDPALARETFLKFRNTYHPICTKMVGKDLEI